MVIIVVAKRHSVLQKHMWNQHYLDLCKPSSWLNDELFWVILNKKLSLVCKSLSHYVSKRRIILDRLISLKSSLPSSPSHLFFFFLLTELETIETVFSRLQNTTLETNRWHHGKNVLLLYNCGLSQIDILCTFKLTHICTKLLHFVKSDNSLWAIWKTHAVMAVSQKKKKKIKRHLTI